MILWVKAMHPILVVNVLVVRGIVKLVRTYLFVRLQPGLQALDRIALSEENFSTLGDCGKGDGKGGQRMWA